MIKYSIIFIKHKNSKIYGLTPYNTAILQTSTDKIIHKRNNQSKVHLEVEM
jgi:hypothetical protein